MEVRAKKGLGQHFLTDQAIAQNIVGALKGSPVLEVGPGMGVLTRYLLTRSDGVCRASTASQSSAPPFASLTVPPLNVPRVAVVSPSRLATLALLFGSVEPLRPFWSDNNL